MRERAYYATASVGPFKEGAVVLLPADAPTDTGWLATGYLQEIGRPDSGHGESPHPAE